MTNKSKKISSEISAGELLDKISILEIKISKITDINNLSEVKKEHKILVKTQSACIEITDEIKKLYNDIKEINLVLWNTEDKIRICEKNQDFGKNFIKLARDVYICNDKRAKIKSEINKILGSNIKEVKSHY